MSKTTEAITELGDHWHNFLCAIAETLIVWGWMLMPEGPEKKQMNIKLYEYHLWAKDNEI